MIVGLAMIVLDFFGIKTIIDYPEEDLLNLLFGLILVCYSLMTIIAGVYIWKRNKVWD